MQESASLTVFKSEFWRQTVFELVSIICVAFLVLTLGAMLIYPGGTHIDHQAPGYSFFTNFFSDLGRTVAHNGRLNPVASTLFLLALGSAGVGLILFFIAFRQFFQEQMWLGCLGTAAGMAAGACFIGVAATPANLYGPAHGQFVTLAFRLFLLASLLYSIAIYRHKQFPRSLGLVFVLFCGVLTNYVVLMTRGPALDTAAGVLIQATGQKVIAYASIACVLVQSLASIKLTRAAVALSR